MFGLVGQAAQAIKIRYLEKISTARAYGSAIQAEARAGAMNAFAAIRNGDEERRKR